MRNEIQMEKHVFWSLCCLLKFRIGISTVHTEWRSQADLTCCWWHLKSLSWVCVKWCTQSRACRESQEHLPHAGLCVSLSAGTTKLCQLIWSWLKYCSNHSVSHHWHLKLLFSKQVRIFLCDWDLCDGKFRRGECRVRCIIVPAVLKFIARKNTEEKKRSNAQNQDWIVFPRSTSKLPWYGNWLVFLTKYWALIHQESTNV